MSMIVVGRCMASTPEDHDDCDKDDTHWFIKNLASIHGLYIYTNDTLTGLG